MIRARVTQVTSLLKLPEELKAKLLADEPEVKEWSIRRAGEAAADVLDDAQVKLDNAVGQQLDPLAQQLHSKGK